MAYKLELHELAEDELWEAVDWYDKQKKKLGREFAKTLQVLMKAIKTRPLLYPVVSKKRRKAVLKRFPYIVIFEIKGDTIFVLAIFHTRRNPKIWKKR